MHNDKNDTLQHLEIPAQRFSHPEIAEVLRLVSFLAELHKLYHFRWP
jgi:hypothetical protein